MHMIQTDGYRWYIQLCSHDIPIILIPQLIFHILYIYIYMGGWGGNTGHGTIYTHHHIPSVQNWNIIGIYGTSSYVPIYIYIYIVDAPGDPSQRDCFLAWHRKRPWFSALSHGGGEKAVSHVHPWSIDTLEHNGESLQLPQISLTKDAIYCT